jgi:hypothetical protein
MNRQQRKIFTLVFGLLILAGPAVGILYGISRWPSQPTDQVALVGADATVVTVWLAFLAAVVALLAYRLADQSPELEVLLKVTEAPTYLGFDFAPRPLREGFDLKLGKRPPVAPSLREPALVIDRPRELVFILKNVTGYTARNPAVRVRGANLYLASSTRADWEGDRGSVTNLDLFWQGRVNVAIHGHMSLDLPGLALADGSNWATPSIRLSIEVFAEGFHLKEQRIDIRVERERPATLPPAVAE